VATGKEIPVSPGPSAEVQSLAFSADGKRLFSAGQDGVLTWDVAKRSIDAGAGAFPRDNVTCVGLAPDGKQLVLASGKRTRFWELSPAKPVGDWFHVKWSVHSVAVSSNGELLAGGCRKTGAFAIAHEKDQELGSEYSTLCLWDRASGKRLPLTIAGVLDN